VVGINTGVIMSSLANVTVKGGSGSGDLKAYVGGLAGRNDGVIQSSLSMGAVTGGSNAYVGGLTGYNTGLLQDTYAISAVTGGSNSYVGGLGRLPCRGASVFRLFVSAAGRQDRDELGVGQGQRRVGQLARGARRIGWRRR
jgi:hypothetical protein